MTHYEQVAGLWIQDWSGKIVTDFGTRVFWNWKWNETWYPGLDTVIRDLDAEGVKVTAYMTAHLNIDGDVYGEAAEVGLMGLMVLKPQPPRRITGCEHPMGPR